MGFRRSGKCDLLRGFERRLTPVMRQHHVAGEKAFVDYSGKRIGIADPATGEIRHSPALATGVPRGRPMAEIFVGVLGASNLIYAEATWTQKLPDWTGAHVRMFRLFGGAPKLLVPDSLKSGVNKASFSVRALARRPTRRSTEPMAQWPRIIRSESFRRDRTSRATKRRSKPASGSPRTAFSGGCAR
jgi:transposase